MEDGRLRTSGASRFAMGVRIPATYLPEIKDRSRERGCDCRERDSHLRPEAGFQRQLGRDTESVSLRAILHGRHKPHFDHRFSAQRARPAPHEQIAALLLQQRPAPLNGLIRPVFVPDALLEPELFRRRQHFRELLRQLSPDGVDYALLGLPAVIVFAEMGDIDGDPVSFGSRGGVPSPFAPADSRPREQPEQRKEPNCSEEVGDRSLGPLRRFAL